MTAKSIPSRRAQGTRALRNVRSSWIVIWVIVLGFGGTNTANAAGDCEPWTAKTDMPTGRLGCRSTVADGKIFVVGGELGDGGASLSAEQLEELDPVTDSWRSRESMPTARRFLAFSAAGGKLYAIGGNQWNGAQALQTVEVYDPTLDEWTGGSDMPTARFAMAAAVVDDQIYVIGGATRATNGGVTGFSNLVEVYDPEADSWSDRTAAPIRRVAQAAGVVDGRIYVFGGTPDGFSTFLRTVEVYDPEADTWQVLGDMPTPRALFSAVVLDGQIYAIAGEIAFGRVVGTVDIFDPRAGLWTEGPELPRNRVSAAATALNGRVYTIGGAETTALPHPPDGAVLEYDTRFNASFSLSSDPGSVGEEILFDATSTVSPSGATVGEYRWNFGDETTAEGAVVGHSYAGPGRFEVELEVTDDNGTCRLAQKFLPVNAPPSELVAPWQEANIGDPAFSGSAVMENDGDVSCLSVYAGGESFTGRGGDSFYFLYQEVSGDMVSRGRIDQLAPEETSLTLGLMLRENLDPGSRHATMVVESVQGQGRFRFRKREETGALVGAISGESFEVPGAWLELRRSGSELIGSSSHDGETWSEVGRIALDLPETALAGVAAFKRDTDTTGPFLPLAATVCELEVTAIAPEPDSFRRADCNGDGTVDNSDPIATLGALFLGEGGLGCKDACDSNDDGTVDLSDAITTLGVLFLGNGIIPVPGMSECGVDPTDDDVGCETPPESCE